MNAPVLFCNPTQRNSSAVEGKYGTKSPSPFPKNKKAPTPLGPLPRRPSPAQGPCEAGPETPRPRTGRGFSGLAAPPGGRGAHCGPGSRSTWPWRQQKSLGRSQCWALRPTRCVGTELRLGSRQTYQESAPTPKFPAV